METRRIRRLERRRVHRITVLYAAVAVIGVAVGVALPQSTTLSVALFAVAACSLVVVAMRGESTAPLHGLHRVVRLPLRTSASATLESFGSRLAGSARALVRLGPAPVPVVLDEPDDEAESWWGPVTAPLTPPAAAPPAPSTPVVAAAMASARVASDGTNPWARISQLWTTLRSRAATLARKSRRWGRGAGGHDIAGAGGPS